jgi:cellulose synthase/poly-beta-1,6-N-acetylglucosamine synthase-like glycosyltransferase
VSILGIIFSMAALLVALFGASAFLLSCLYLRRRPPPAAVPSLLADWPSVTVQLPVYNELHVVERLIDAVADLDYPHDRLQIQVLDDSTDETTRLAQVRARRHRARGLEFEVIHREDRSGFKAGALAQGLKTARGELIAIFDADFCPAPDFLRRTVPPLAEDPGLAFVQARWGYLNAGYSALTRAQTLALDGHFVVEHCARNRSGLLINFNGTAGVWRRSAIEDAGGWQSNTLTEDVDLSFRAQLGGWHALYLPDVVAPAELPPQVAAFRRQQARWATGAAQCLFKLGRSLLRGRFDPQTNNPHAPSGPPPGPGREREGTRLSWLARLEGLLHLSVWIAHPMSLVLLLLTPLMLLGRIPITLNLSIFWLMALGPIVAYTLSQQHLYRDWRSRMLYMPVLALLGTGLALSNTVAIAQGLTGQRVPFRRTPKFRLEDRSGAWASSLYALPFEWITLGELALAAFALATTALALSVGHYFSVPFLLLYVCGYGLMSFQGLHDAWLAWRAHPPASRPAAIADSKIEWEG